MGIMIKYTCLLKEDSRGDSRISRTYRHYSKRADVKRSIQVNMAVEVAEITLEAPEVAETVLLL